MYKYHTNMSKTFLITGGSGFIGTNMVDYISNKGHVIVIDKSKPINFKFKKSKKNKIFFYLI